MRTREYWKVRISCIDLCWFTCLLLILQSTCVVLSIENERLPVILLSEKSLVFTITTSTDTVYGWQPQRRWNTAVAYTLFVTHYRVLQSILHFSRLIAQ